MIVERLTVRCHLIVPVAVEHLLNCLTGIRYVPLQASIGGSRELDQDLNLFYDSRPEALEVFTSTLRDPDEALR